MRYWTSDWHLNSEIVRQTSHRPWKTAEEMNAAILKLVKNSKIAETDQIIHVGDLIQSGKDRGTEIAKDHQLKWEQIAMKCAGCQLICIEGNHDSSNDVPFICRSMKTRVGNYNVTVGHYPTWHERAAGTFDHVYDRHPGFHICGHVHEAWKVAFDEEHNILNINVGIDVHKYKLLSEADLVELIDKALVWWKHLCFLNYSSDHWEASYKFADWEKDIAKQKLIEAADKKAKMMEWLKVNKPEIYAAKMKKASK